MTIKCYVGVDGCKAGWFAVVIGSDDSVAFTVFESITDWERSYDKYIDGRTLFGSVIVYHARRE